MLMQVAPLAHAELPGGEHLIRALALEPEVHLSLMSYTLNMLKTPVRDGLGFACLGGGNCITFRQEECACQDAGTAQCRGGGGTNKIEILKILLYCIVFYSIPFYSYQII